jgi:hypothetical protein
MREGQYAGTSVEAEQEAKSRSDGLASPVNTH